ncbi:unnamed protein product, partial [Urochloa humidicola]
HGKSEKRGRPPSQRPTTASNPSQRRPLAAASAPLPFPPSSGPPLPRAAGWPRRRLHASLPPPGFGDPTRARARSRSDRVSSGGAHPCRRRRRRRRRQPPRRRSSSSLSSPPRERGQCARGRLPLRPSCAKRPPPARRRTPRGPGVTTPASWRILSRYGVRAFPTLFLVNSTMRVRYHGSRTMNSLAMFYKDVTGMNPVSLDATSLDRLEDTVTIIDNVKKSQMEDSLLSWARSPDRLLHQDTCLALASSFVLLRLLHFLLPKLNACMKQAWRMRLYELNRLFPSMS